MDVGKLSNYLKLCELYFFTLDQFFLYFIIQTVSNGPRFMMLQSFFAVLLLLHFMFLQHSISISFKGSKVHKSKIKNGFLQNSFRCAHSHTSEYSFFFSDALPKCLFHFVCISTISLEITECSHN